MHTKLTFFAPVQSKALFSLILSKSTPSIILKQQQQQAMSSSEEEEEIDREVQEEDRKPGQKFVTPSPGFSDRVFYESLLEQRPDRCA
jgi:hypothetical protein